MSEVTNQNKRVELARYKETIENMNSSKYSLEGQLNLACWLGERAHFLVAEIEYLRAKNESLEPLREALDGHADACQVGRHFLELMENTNYTAAEIDAAGAVMLSGCGPTAKTLCAAQSLLGRVLGAICDPADGAMLRPHPSIAEEIRDGLVSLKQAMNSSRPGIDEGAK